MAEERYKIVCLIHTLQHKGGMQRVAANLANYWAETGHDVEIWTFMNAESFYTINENIAIRSFGDIDAKTLMPKAISKLLRFYAAEKNYKALLKEHRPDIVLMHRGGVQDPFVGFQRFYGERTLELLHLPFKQPRGVFSWYIELQQSFYYKFFQPKKNLVVLNNATKEEALAAGWTNVHCIHNALSFRSDRKADLDAKCFLAIGRDVPQKGFDVLIKAFAMVASKHKDWKLKIIGDGVTEPNSKISRSVKELGLNGQVELLEPVRNILDHYLSSSVYVLSSYFEGMPMVLLEAMECGLPVITSNIVGIDEVVSDSCALKFEQGDHDELAEKMRHIIEDGTARKNMGIAASSHVQEFYLENIDKSWMRLFAETTKKKNNF